MKTAEKTTDARFPLGGIDVSTPVSRQMPVPLPPPFEGYARTTPSAVNVRAFDALAGRLRGGSRPGLVRYVPVPLVADWIVQHVGTITGNDFLDLSTWVPDPVSAAGDCTFGALESGNLEFHAAAALTFGALVSFAFAAVVTVEVTAAGACTFGPLTSDVETAVGVPPVTADGTCSFGALAAAGAATLPIEAVGSPSFGALTTAGAGTYIAAITGAGACTFGAMTTSGAVSYIPQITAGGACTFGALTAAGLANYSINASAAITFGALSAAGDSRSASEEDNVAIGGYASRPSAGNSGRLYRATDAPLTWRDNGTDWDLYQPVYALYADRIILGNWTAANIGTGTVTDVNGSIFIKAQTNGSDQLRYYKKTLVAASNYTIKAVMIAAFPTTTFQQAMVGVRESSSGKVCSIGISNESSSFAVSVSAMNFTNDTTFSANVPGGARVGVPDIGGRPVYVKIVDDNTNRTYSWSLDDINYVTLGSQGRTAFGTPDQIMFGTNCTETTYTPCAAWLFIKES